MTPIEWIVAALAVAVVIALYRIAQDVEAIKEHLMERGAEDEGDEDV